MHNRLYQKDIYCSIGVTLIELLLTMAIMATLCSIAVPIYADYAMKIRSTKAISDITDIELVIEKFYAERGSYPISLAQIGRGGLMDPWGRPYQYLNLANVPNKKECRKIRNVHPINTDFDLYSMGKDGKSEKPLNAGPSWDDIVRAYNGSFVGIAKDII